MAICKRLRIAMSDCGSLYGKSGLRPSEGPVMWQKLSEVMNRVAGDTGQDVFEPGEGIDIHALTGGYESAQHSGRSTADIAASSCCGPRPHHECCARCLCCRFPDARLPSSG